MNIIVVSVIILGAIGCIAAVILYFVAQKFKVEEDVRIDQVVEVLPGANCGGCGYPGCRGFSEACVKSDTLEGKLCPVGGQPVMQKVAAILGMQAGEVVPKVAVVRCNGTCSNRKKTNTYDGAKNCRIASGHYAGDTGCSFGCFGFGDCQAVCPANAIVIDSDKGIAEIIEDKCVGCGACVKACPRSIIELRNKGPKGKRVYVGCVNKDKGAVAKKACNAACIGCGKCAKTCPFEAITVQNNVAYIDFTKCKMCRKCVTECPTGAIKDVNFPTPAVKVAKPVTPVAEKPVAEKPVAATPVAEKPVVNEKSVVEEKIVVTEKPVIEQAKVEETIIIDEPKVNEPKAEEPKVEEPKVEEPKAEEPKVEEPKVEEPKEEEPKAEEPKVEKKADAQDQSLF